MCQRSMLVPIPAFLLDDGIRDSVNNAHPEYGHDAQGVMCFKLDECIVGAVQALWAAGIRTIGCCCGHGSGHGVISLETPVPAVAQAAGALGVDLLGLGLRLIRP